MEQRPPIKHVFVRPDTPQSDGESHSVGYAGVTKIDFGITPGLHANMETIRVWQGEHLHAEYPFMSTVGVQFEPPPPAPAYTCATCEDGMTPPEGLDYGDPCPACTKPMMPF